MKNINLMSKMILHELESIVGGGNVITAEADLVPYTVDFFWVPRLLIDRGGLPPMPDVVVLPEQLMKSRWLRNWRISITFR